MDDRTREAYAQIVAVMAQWAWRLAAAEPESLREDYEARLGRSCLPIFYHYSARIEERIAEILVSVRILLDDGSDPNTVAFEFACQPANFYSVALTNAANGPPFAYTLAWFAETVDGYNKWSLVASKVRTPFYPLAEIAPAFDALVPLGYVKKQADAYYWRFRMCKLLAKHEH